MPVCKLCNNKFPIKAEINGKFRNLQRRKYCIICSPFGCGNTRKLELPQLSSNELKKRKSKSSIISQRKMRVKRKSELVLLLGGKCIICNYSRCLRALDFHHIEGKSEKSFGISSNGMLAKWSTLLEEIKKCVCVCATCHREIHDGLHPKYLNRRVAQK